MPPDGPTPATPAQPPSAARRPSSSLSRMNATRSPPRRGVGGARLLPWCGVKAYTLGATPGKTRRSGIVPTASGGGRHAAGPSAGSGGPPPADRWSGRPGRYPCARPRPVWGARGGGGHCATGAARRPQVRERRGGTGRLDAHAGGTDGGADLPAASVAPADPPAPQTASTGRGSLGRRKDLGGVGGGPRRYRLALRECPPTGVNGVLLPQPPLDAGTEPWGAPPGGGASGASSGAPRGWDRAGGSAAGGDGRPKALGGT